MPKFIDRTGETNIASNHMIITIIAYRKYNDIDIMFEDNTIIKHTDYKSFKNGTIKHPTQSYTQLKSTKIQKQRLGETKIANNGMEMTIIAYRTGHDIDIQFADGTIRTNVSYHEFKRGSIGHPNINTNKSYGQKHIGETNVATNGLKMTIIAYRGCKDIDIQFEDNTIVYHKSYYGFQHGQIEHPTIKAKKFCSDHHIGETIQAKNGLYMTIIDVNKIDDITVQFENNIIRTHVRYANFKQRQVSLPKQINNIIIGPFAYIFENNWYYECYHPDWKEPHILSVQEIYDYQHEVA